jgi:hypothetical protein
MQQRDPNLVRSGLSRRVTSGGLTATVEIYRLEDQPGWSLEVVDEDRASIIWDDLFPTDDKAFDVFQAALKEEGMVALLGRSNVIRFPR